MHIVKLRVSDETGLIPAGRYFEQLAKTLRAANERASSSQREAEDRDLESTYRRTRRSRAVPLEVAPSP